jgi:hypothetical protein
MLAGLVPRLSKQQRANTTAQRYRRAASVFAAAASTSATSSSWEIERDAVLLRLLQQIRGEVLQCNTLEDHEVPVAAAL